MPSILTQSYITATVLGEEYPDVNLGSVLPDFAGMYKDATGREQDIRSRAVKSVALEIGINFHHRTDRVFDDQPQKPLITQSFAAELESAGLPYKAARLGAAFISEILLDKALLDDPAAWQAFDHIADTVRAPGSALYTSNFEKEYKQRVKNFFTNRVPEHYGNPRKVATMAYERLNMRALTKADLKRKAFPEAKIPVVAEVIEQEEDRIKLLGLVALYNCILDLKSEQPALTR